MSSDLGIGQALIFHPEDERTASTAFWIGQASGIVLCALTWLAAPLAGSFFNDPRAVPVVQVLSLTFPISAFGNTHDILLRKRLQFGKKFFPDFIKSTGKGLISIFLAWLGMGAWSLILGQLAGKLLASISYWVLMPWRPSLLIDRKTLRPLLRYGSNIMAGDLLGIILNNTDYLFIGRFLGATALGIYSVAFRIPDLVVMQFCDTISRVIFPLYSRLKDDPTALTRGFLVTMRYVSLVTVPLGLGIALLSKLFVVVFFTDKWIEAAPVMAAIAIYALMLSLSYNAGDIYKAQGRPEVLTYLSLGRTAVLLPGLYWAAAIQNSIVSVGWVHAGVAFLTGLVELTIAARLLKTPFGEVLAALRPAGLSGLAMAAGVILVLSLTGGLPEWMQLAASISSGAVIYLGLLFLFDRDLIRSAGKTLRASLAR